MNFGVKNVNFKIGFTNCDFKVNFFKTVVNEFDFKVILKTVFGECDFQNM